jgi:hypothetical protein
MFKPLNSIMAGAFIAAAITVLSVPAAKVDAHSSSATGNAAPACVERPWPYLHCVGTAFGGRHIRLVTTDHIAQ